MGSSQFPTSWDEFDGWAESAVMYVDQPFEMLRQIPDVLDTGFGDGAIDDRLGIADEVPQRMLATAGVQTGE